MNSKHKKRPGAVSRAGAANEYLKEPLQSGPNTTFEANHLPQRSNGTSSAPVPPTAAPVLQQSSSLTGQMPVRPVPWLSLVLLAGLCLALVLLPLFYQTPNPTTGEGLSGIWLVFLIGLTTGGLSCMVVQGGLLAATIAQREKELLAQGTSRDNSGRAGAILAFLGAKLVAYTLLGALLGWLGSVVTLSITGQALLNLLAGLFMLATALNLLNVHPVFRYVVIQPPRAAMRYLRRFSKSETLFTPALLGLMTVLIPCGTTQAMEVLAISSGNPLTGALIMAAFVLGTGPIFFGLGYFATRLGGLLQVRFMKMAAAGIIILSVLTINGALNVLDSPVTLNSVGRYLFDTGGRDAAVTGPDEPLITPAAVAGGGTLPEATVNQMVQSPAAIQTSSVQEVQITATNTEYLPGNVQVKSGQPFKINIVTNRTVGCTRSIVFRSLGVQKILPVSGKTVIDVPAQKPGTIRYVCSMGMYGGTITVI